MTSRQTNRSRVLRRVGVALAAAVTVSTVSSTAISAASKPAAVKTGGVAKVAIFDTFSGWCFGNNLANSALMAAHTVYETLFERNADGKLVGLLAKSAVATNGGKTWTVTLRSGIKFHDGTDFDADAVVSNFNYITGQAHFAALGAEAVRLTPAIGATGLTGNPVSGVVTTKQKTAFTKAYAKAIAAGKTQAKAAGAALLSAAGVATSVTNYSYVLSTALAFTANILTVTADGTDKVVFKLQRAQNDFDGTLLASGRFFMRAPSQFATNAGGSASECANNPIGTGPFMLESKSKWSTNRLEVVKNPDYWRTDADGNKLPYLDGIIFQNIKEAPQRAAAIKTGAYDAAMFSSAGEGNNIVQLRKQKVKEVKSGVEYFPSLWLNQGKPGSPFANADARAAVVTCINRAAFFKVRQNSQGAIAKSLVGPKSVMYSAGIQAFNVKKAKASVAKYKAATKAKKLSFTIPADVSAASQANVKFLKAQWAKCGIEAKIRTSEAAEIIATAFNASPDLTKGEYYNGYDAISITLFEGNDVSFNLPFVLTNSFSQGTGTGTTKFYGSELIVSSAAELAQNGTAANAAATRAAVYDGVGQVLGLNHHSDLTIDDCFFEQQAKTDVNAVDYGSCTKKLIDNNVMTSVTHFYYSMFFSKKGKLGNIGTLLLPDGDTRRLMSNYGIDWTGVSKG